MVVFDNAVEEYNESTMFYVVATGYKRSLEGQGMVYHVLLCSAYSPSGEQDEMDIVAEDGLAAGPVCLVGESVFATICDVKITMTADEVEWTDNEWCYKFET